MLSGNKKRNEYTDAYLDFYPTVYSAVYTKINDKDEADDICQEIFLIFYDKFDFIDDKRRWLYLTTKNLLLSHYKKKRFHGSENIEISDDTGIAFENGFRDTRILLEDAINHIECDDIERTMLDLIAVHNFSYERVSEIIGITIKQVRYKYGLLVKKLYNYMQNIGIKEMGELL